MALSGFSDTPLESFYSERGLKFIAEGDGVTELIAIDESGDLGLKGSRYFVVAALVTERSRNLLKAYKAIPKGNAEVKFYYSTHKEKEKVLTEVSRVKASIVYTCVDKEKQIDTYGSGKVLYQRALEEVIRNALEISVSKDVNVLVDRSRYIKNDELKEMVKELSQDIGKNVIKCEKVSFNKCVSVADFVAGSIWTKYESGNDEFFKILTEMIRRP